MKSKKLTKKTESVDILIINVTSSKKIKGNLIKDLARATTSNKKIK